MNKTLLFLALGGALVGCSSAPDTTASTSAEYGKVQAIFDKNCVKCHSETRGPNGIHLTSHDLVMQGGKEGPIVKAGDPDNSFLIKALKGQAPAKQMPPPGRGIPLTPDELKTIEDWVKGGAKA